MTDLILSDTHFFPRRQAGTTLESRFALEEWLLDSFEEFLDSFEHDRLFIVGDLLDKVSVSEKTIKRIVQILRKEQEVILIEGNHCRSQSRYGEISSHELIAALLPNATLIQNHPLQLGNYYIIPHLFNQEAFDAAIAAVPNNVCVMVHTNINNPFATGDHSLNVTDAQITSVLDKNCTMICGHEHKARDLYEGRIKVLGCAFPTSIADCLGGDKRALLGGKSIETWSSKDFKEIAYTDEFEGHEHFISINGTCPQAEYASVVKRVAAFRAKSDAFVIKNSVKVPEREKSEINQEVTSFNIVDVFMSELPKEFQERVKSCLSQE